MAMSALAAAVIAGCGGSTPGGSGDTAGATTTPTDNGTAFADCVRDANEDVDAVLACGDLLTTSGGTTADPSIAPNPDASYSSNCTYLLGDFSTGPSGFRFVADAQVTNTGNIGVVAELRASWRQAGGTSIKMTKRVKVPYAQSRDVGVVKRVTRDQIDQIQSVSGDDCTAVVAVVDTFGAAQ